MSGRYSQPKANGEVSQNGLKPAGLKELVGKGHEEFASMRQQGESALAKESGVKTRRGQD
jgi:uncharacterized UBP type Zn finger protein